MKVGAIIRMAACVFAASLPLVAFAGPATDTDGDTVPDVIDNCSTVSNAGASGCDTDMDGYGNLCDGDFNQNLAVNAGDIAPFITAIGALDPNADANCNGAVNAGDIAPFIGLLSSPIPGPSGLSCAGSPPCS